MPIMVIFCPRVREGGGIECLQKSSYSLNVRLWVAYELTDSSSVSLSLRAAQLSNMFSKFPPSKGLFLGFEIQWHCFFFFFFNCIHVVILVFLK